MLQYLWVKINLQQRGVPSNRNLLPIQLELYIVLHPAVHRASEAEPVFSRCL